MTSRDRTLLARKDGFTLLELLVVVVILGLLASVAIPTFAGAIRSSHDASAQATLHSIALEAQALMLLRGDGKFQDEDIVLVAQEIPALARAGTWAAPGLVASSVEPAIRGSEGSILSYAISGNKGELGMALVSGSGSCVLVQATPQDVKDAWARPGSEECRGLKALGGNGNGNNNGNGNGDAANSACPAGTGYYDAAQSACAVPDSWGAWSLNGGNYDYPRPPARDNKPATSWKATHDKLRLVPPQPGSFSAVVLSARITAANGHAVLLYGRRDGETVLLGSFAATPGAQEHAVVAFAPGVYDWVELDINVKNLTILDVGYRP